MNNIKLLGSINKQHTVILVDNGNFLDPKLLSQLKKEPKKANPLVATVAKEDQVLCDSMSRKLKWQITGGNKKRKLENGRMKDFKGFWSNAHA